MGRNRVFILGAGFSKQAGLPLATELTSLVLDKTVEDASEDFQEWIAGLKKRIAMVERVGGGGANIPNIEQLFDFAKYDEELWRMKQQLSTVGRYCGTTPWAVSEDISTWLGHMEEDLPQVIWDAQTTATLDPIRRFTGCLSPDDTIITFNYDTLVEQALESAGYSWNHGLNDAPSGGVTVLKMHGSINWVLLERRPENDLTHFIKLFSKRDSNVEEHGADPPTEDEYFWELWRGKDVKVCSSMIEQDAGGWANFHSRIGLAGLGQYKPLHTLPGSALTWNVAFKALSAADEVWTIGFSMSPYDTMVRFHFGSVVGLRQQPPSRVVVVDPNAEALAKSFRGVFGSAKLCLLSQLAENVDWPKMLRS